MVDITHGRLDSLSTGLRMAKGEQRDGWWSHV